MDVPDSPIHEGQPIKKAFCLLCFLFGLLIACQQSAPDAGVNTWSLSGKTNTISDGTLIYFVDVLSNQVFDSASIDKNSFHIEKILPVSPTHIYIHNKDYSVFRSVWVENNPMIFDGAEGDFSEAKVTGSKTQDEFELLLQQTDTIESDERRGKVEIEFVRKHPDSRVSASMLAGYAPHWGKDVVKKLYDSLSTENKESVYGLQIARFIALNRKHEIGDSYTDFEMKNTTGDIIKLSDKLGQVTLLHFWASWCGPCRQQTPGLVEAYKKYNAAGFEIFSVSLDFSKDDWERIIEKDSMTWSHVSDLKGRNSTAGIIYGVNAIPDNFLIDAEGKIFAKYLWGEDLNQAIEDKLRKN